MSDFPARQHREMIDAISNTIMPIYQLDDSEDLKQWIPQIVRMCQQMTAEDQRLLAYVTDLHMMSVKAGMADWAARDGATLADQGWSQLADALEAVYPELA